MTNHVRRTPLYIWREFLHYFLGLPPTLARPVPKSSNCLEQRIHTLFAARISAEYSLLYPGRKSAWCGAVPWEVRCGVIRSRMRRKQGNRIQ
jgi:hypothetical protein